MRCLAYLVAAVFFVPGIASADSWLPENTTEEIAVVTALSKGFINRDEQSTCYEGIYNGMRGGCDLVTVRVTYLPEADRGGRTDLFNYRVCNGRISEPREFIRTDFGIPEGIDDFAQNIARRAQKNGSASGDYQGFKVLGRIAQLQDNCSVDVRIMWEGKLYGRNTLNGCQ